LIRRPSVTPKDEGALGVLEAALKPLGFVCHRMTFKTPGTPDIENLYARLGTGKPNLCFAGHTDVVPVGDRSGWSVDPFAGEIRDGRLYGRGAADMKGAIAAFAAAAAAFLKARGSGFKGSISFLITGDEEGPAINGTQKMLAWMAERGETIDACIVGEPTSTNRFGDTIKNGRRGSLNGRLRVRGQQCHIAYPERGRNPIHDAAPAIATLVSTEWDRGNEYFQPTSFQISNTHAGTGASNIIPGVLEVAFNFRFSPESPSQQLQTRVREILNRHNLQYDIEWTLIGDPFLTRRGALVDAVVTTVESVAGIRPALSTSGGTSDGRFLATLAREVVEFGPLNESIHKIDEHVRIADLEPLSIIYERTVANCLHLP